MSEYDPINKQPRRRIVFVGSFGADDWDGLKFEFLELAREIASHGSLTKRSISGGYSSGHIFVTSEDGSIDHDSWAKELDEYLAREKLKFELEARAEGVRIKDADA